MINAVRKTAFASVVVAFASSAYSATVELPRVDNVVEIDGVLGEAEWRAAVQVELSYETWPGENIPSKIKTVAYLMEDGSNLYVGFAASDPDPSEIRAYLRDRDNIWDDDTIGIVIDTYNDGLRSFEFFSNPLGVQADLTGNEAGEEGENGKTSDAWDAIWDSAGQINDSGYAVEMKIPLTQLRFPAIDDVKTWGFTVIRDYPRDKRYSFSNIKQDRGINCFLCQLDEFSGLADAVPGRDFEIVPTLTASMSETTDEPGIDPLVSSSRTEAGLSLRWGITPDLTANLAINPDFSQLEADVAQLAVNNRFALFFPEKRPFFLEGADYFTTPIRAVFTRTITSPDIGAKLTGKRGNNTFGLIAAQDAITNLLFPGQFGSDSETLEQPNTVFVGRYNRTFGDASSVGGLLTVRDGDGYHNYVGGFDTRWKVNDQHTLRAQYLKTETEYPADVALEFDQPSGSFDGNGVLATYEFDSRNWFVNLRHIRLTEGFRVDSGFQSKVGGGSNTVGIGRVWHGEEDDWWTRVRLHSEYKIGHLQDGTFAEKNAVVRLGFGGPLQSWYQIMLGTSSELESGTVFDKQRIGVYTEMTPRRGLSFAVFAMQAEQIDYDNIQLGDQLLIEPRINWNVSRHLLLDMQGFFVKFKTKEGEKIFDASVVDARLTWQFNLRSFLRLTVQHSKASRNLAVYVDPGAFDAEEKDVGRQLLYSYKINPQTVFFLGYSDQYVDEDRLDGLTASDRSIFLKIGYAWNL